MRTATLKKYQGVVDALLVTWLEKFGYDASELLESEAGILYVMVDEDDSVCHPDDPNCHPSSYPFMVDLSEITV